MNTSYLLGMRKRFDEWLREVAAVHPPTNEVDLAALADTLTTIVEGAIILSKALADPRLMGKQTRLFRNHVKLLFGG
jgi:TetR/AcrR family transcriptional repressor of nem operon